MIDRPRNPLRHDLTCKDGHPLPAVLAGTMQAITRTQQRLDAGGRNVVLHRHGVGSPSVPFAITKIRFRMQFGASATTDGVRFGAESLRVVSRPALLSAITVGVKFEQSSGGSIDFEYGSIEVGGDAKR